MKLFKVNVMKMSIKMKKTIPFTLLTIAFFISSLLPAQQLKPDWRKLHYLSEEEMNTPLSTGRNFTPTDPPEGFVRNVAEFDEMQAVLVRYPFGVPLSLIREMAENDTVITIVANAAEQNTVTSMYQNNGVDLNHCKFLYAQTDSYWVRDYGPWFVFDGDLNAGIVDFPYNRPRPNDNNIPAAVANYLGIDLYGMDLTHTGGNYMCSGMGQAASTDLVYDENPSLTHEQIDTLVHDYLGIDTYHVTLDPLGDYIKHIDCWGKFLAPDKVLIGQVPPSDPRYNDYEMVAAYFSNQISSWGDYYKVYRVFTPGNSQVTPYTNSLILNNKVYVPVTGNQYDADALAIYEEAMPGYEIIGIQYSGWLNTDALHCRTKGVADTKMLYIWHVPLLGDVPYQENFEIEADIYNAGGQSVYTDSALIYYNVNGGTWQTATLSHQYGYYWNGSIGGFSPGDTVRYYLFAADHSGRRSFQPRMNVNDPHMFVVGPWQGTALVFSPDTVWFQNQQQMFDGITLDIVNVSPDSVNITGIQDFGYMFPWHIDTLPPLPYGLPPDDTLTLTVYCDPYVSAPQTMLYDTIHIYAGDDVFGEPTMADSDVLDGFKEVENSGFSVYPNPFSKRLLFRPNETVKGPAIIDIYNGQGKQLIHKTVWFNPGKSVIINTYDFKYLSPSGEILFYRITTGEKRFTGKIIYLP